jgi:hypothetical protein
MIRNSTLLAEFRELVESAGIEAVTDAGRTGQTGLSNVTSWRKWISPCCDRSRECFSIGYNVSQYRLDASCYDLLASEARLASFVCIALGQLPQRHWFALGRLLTTAGGNATLISWSGSMFSISCVMSCRLRKHPHRSLCRSAIHIEYGKQMVCRGACRNLANLRDTNANYQYRAFACRVLDSNAVWLKTSSSPPRHADRFDVRASRSVPQPGAPEP